MCYDRYRYLQQIKDNRIDKLFDIEKTETVESYKLSQNFISVFIPEQENDLVLIIYTLINEGKNVTVNEISENSRTMYYSPICIATKSLFISFSRNKD
ncbi:hypothetical protein M9Y10_025611 [Tritrichomonas musculus]|uniref:Uncharacterized protein n=1 Tax=Tritrichomonas musculus TaxID=1915356 RepID=A0ABR2HB16_9EUKA